MAERQFGPYRLMRQIAVGGMAEIHLAKTKGIAGFEKYVALKMIHPNFAEDEQFIEMLVDEAKIAVQLTHGNIAQTFDLGRVGETYYITMEFVDGADLYKVLRRGSEMDLDVPLDVCAFIGKEVGAALDYAHRKRDHSGKSLGIVHRDVSPQNVLVSHAGEVKLVDFGIAKATMKARQTAVGVIKGKYYYMSPEQAWGDPLDHRSDIFSSGIVLYEMVTGQMLYLEEDLHKLLDMARKADIAPPSRLRKGVPPQLERIIMHALEKEPSARYQNAGDMASDLERFLHSYSPVFTASKVAAMLRQVLGEAVAEPDYVVEMRGGPNATMSLDVDLLAHDKEEIRDENSVIFRLSDLDTKPPLPVAPAPAPVRAPVARASPSAATAPAAVAPAAAPARSTAPMASGAATTRPQIPTKIPAIPGVSARGAKTMPPPNAVASPTTAPGAAGAAPPRAPAKPRQADEETREISQPPPPRADLWAGAGGGDSLDDDLENIAERTMITAAPGMSGLGGGFMSDDGGGDDDLENIGERTLITTMPTDPGTDTNVAAAAASGSGDDTGVGTAAAPGEGGADGFEEGPTTARDFTAPPPKRVTTTKRPAAPPPPALAAKIQTPAVSELRKPRASRRTPPGGSLAQQPNVLQAIVNRAGSEPMPAAPRPPSAPTAAARATAISMPNATSPTMSPEAGFAPDLDSAPTLGGNAASSLNGIPSGPLSQSMPAMMPASGPLSQSMYAHPGFDPNGAQPHQQPHQQHQPLPPTQLQPPPPQQYHQQPYQQPYQQQPQQPPHAPQGYDATGMPLGLQTPPPGYPMQAMPGVPAHLQPYAQAYGQPPQMQMGPQGYPQQLSPAQMYPYHPYAQPAPMPPTLTGQMRAFEVDEIPSQYKLNAGPKWALLVIAGIFAISAAAAVTYFIIRSTRDNTPTTSTVRVVSVPPGAAVFFDGQQLTDRTPLTLDGVPIGTHHEVRVELARHKPFADSIDIPKDGREVPFVATLVPITGHLNIDTTPEGADIYINGELRGRTPKSLSDVDMGSASKLELKLKDYQPVVQTLTWPENGVIDIKAKFVH